MNAMDSWHLTQHDLLNLEYGSRVSYKRDDALRAYCAEVTKKVFADMGNAGIFQSSEAVGNVCKISLNTLIQNIAEGAIPAPQGNIEAVQWAVCLYAMAIDDAAKGNQNYTGKAKAMLVQRLQSVYPPAQHSDAWPSIMKSIPAFEKSIQSALRDGNLQIEPRFDVLKDREPLVLPVVGHVVIQPDGSLLRTALANEQRTEMEAMTAATQKERTSKLANSKTWTDDAAKAKRVRREILSRPEDDQSRAWLAVAKRSEDLKGQER